MSEKLTLNVPNISCGHCVMRIEKALGAMAGVTSVAADAETKKVAVEFEGETATPEKVRSTLADIGYPAEGS